MNELVVEVCHGLCNRLRVLISASYLAEQNGRRLVLCWRPDDACGARFGDLFTNPIAEVDSLPEYPRCLAGTPPGVVAKTVKSLDPIVCVSDYQWLIADAEQRKAIPHFAALSPVDVVREAVNATAEQFRGSTIGVHVRRGDFAEHLPERYNLQLPSLERYFEYLVGWSGTIFLSTDGGEEVVERFRDRYRERVIIHPKQYQGRNTPQAIQEALVDVYLLQDCQAVIGTRYSSFSGLAWTISGVPRARVTDRQASLLSRLKFASKIMLSQIQQQTRWGRWSPNSRDGQKRPIASAA